MIGYIVERILSSIPTVLMITIVGFLLIELPPGDYISYYIQELEAAGNLNAQEEAAMLIDRYDLDQPVYRRFWTWLTHFVQGDFGDSFAHRKPVKELIGQRLLMTVVISLASLIIAWLIGIPLGVFSATHQYSVYDHALTFIAFLGLGVPGFLLALVLLVAGYKWLGFVPSGLFSSEYVAAPWSFARVIDLLKHLWIPASLVAVTSTGSLIRTMRGNLLDVLRVNYVQTARCKGLRESKVVWKHAVRNAIHPLIMSLGMSLPYIVSGSAITAIVLNLPTTGPLYLQAVQQQDTYLAGTIMILLSLSLVVGNLLSDILLVIVDPRIRYD